MPASLVRRLCSILTSGAASCRCRTFSTLTHLHPHRVHAALAWRLTAWPTLLCSSKGSLASSCSSPKFSRLQSVLSHILPIPPTSQLLTLSDYFPDYTHPSSDAELSASPVSITAELHAQYQHSMDQLHSSHPIVFSPSFNITSAAPGDAKAEAPSRSCQAHVDICSHRIEILPEDEEEIWVAMAEAPIKSQGVVVDICNHCMKNLPEDEEETLIAEGGPPAQSPHLQAPFIQEKGSKLPHDEGQQGVGYDTSMHTAAVTADPDAAAFGIACVKAPAQQAESPDPTHDLAFVGEPPYAAPPLCRYASAFIFVLTPIASLLFGQPELALALKPLPD